MLAIQFVALTIGCQRGSSSGAAGGPTRADIPPASDAATVPTSTVSVPAPVPSPTARAAPSAEADFEGTAGIIEKKGVVGKTVVQSDVRAARHAGYDRIVFEFEGPALPSYHLEYVDRPLHRCGSGQVVDIAGEGWLRVRFETAAAHDERGKATIAEADRQRKYTLGMLRELVLTCDFEGQVIWVLGAKSPNRYRVLELQRPTRLVVDIRHR
jgi:hypothetical protein